MRQCFVTTAVCINTIGHGSALGFPGVLLPQLLENGSQIPLSKDAASWTASVLSISLLIGNFITPPIMGRLGRKAAHLAVTLPILAGWIIIILATGVEALIIGRILHGLSFGMLLPLRSALVGEYTSPKNRGAFLTTITLSQAFGIFFVHLIGSFLSWQKTGLVCLFFSFISLVMILYSPESPSWLAARRRYDECKRIFRWLRGPEDEEELKEMIQARLLFDKAKIINAEVGINPCEKTANILAKKEFYKPIILMFHLYLMLQFCGGTSMASYSTVILSNLMGPSVNAHYWMIALDSQRIVTNTIAVYVINKAKRRTMVFATGGLCVISHLAIAAYVYAKANGIFSYDSIWLPGLLINLQILSVATGVIPLPGVIAGEVFPLEYRSIGSSISVIMMSGGMFLVLQSFTTLMDNTGLHGTYFIYAIVLAYNLLVAWFLLPETKDRTLQQIEDEFRGRPLTLEELASKQSLQSFTAQEYVRKKPEEKNATLFS